jgi:serine/threonine protein kinase
MDVSDTILDHLRHVAALPDLTGTRYVVESEIGRGGMGVVYAARDAELDRRVALKILEASFAEEPRVIARLEHPAIVPIYDAGRLPDGRVFYAMKLVAGLSLDRYLAESHTLAERLRVLRRVGEALAFAHSRGAIHRDVKPQNVMVGEFGEVYLMDWGVEAVAGTPAFRAPEARLDSRSDIYALGALLQFVLPESAPPALQAIAAKAMHPNPEARYSSVSALLADLERFQEGRAVEAWSEPWWHMLRRFTSRNVVLLGLLAAYALVKIVVFLVRRA